MTLIYQAREIAVGHGHAHVIHEYQCAIANLQSSLAMQTYEFTMG